MTKLIERCEGCWAVTSKPVWQGQPPPICVTPHHEEATTAPVGDNTPVLCGEILGYLGTEAVAGNLLKYLEHVRSSWQIMGRTASGYGFSVWSLHVLPASAWVRSRYFFQSSKDMQIVEVRWTGDSKSAVGVDVYVLALSQICTPAFILWQLG